MPFCSLHSLGHKMFRDFFFHMELGKKPLNGAAAKYKKDFPLTLDIMNPN